MAILIGMVTLLSRGGGGPRVAGDSSIALDPNSVEFGGQVQGTAGDIRAVSVRNRDAALAVSILSAEISGPNASDFFVETTTCTQVIISPGRSCSVEVRFIPTAAGTRQAILLVHRGDVSGSVSMALRGEGVARPLSAKQPGVDFGQIAVNATSESVMVPATNTSSRPLVMLGVAVAGDHPQDFSIDATPLGCAGITLAPGASCLVTVAFSPTDVGTRTATLAYSYSGSGGPLFVVLTGFGATLPLKVSPVHPDFGKQAVGTTGAPIRITVSTPVGTTVTIGKVTVTGPDAAYFKIVSNTCTGRILVAATGCTVSIQFAPSAIGIRLASLSIVRANEVTVLDDVQLNGFAFVPRPPRVRR